MIRVHSLVHSQKIWVLHVSKRQYLLDHWYVHTVLALNVDDIVWYRFSPAVNCLHCCFIRKSEFLVLTFDCIAKAISQTPHFHAFNNYKRSIDGT